MSDLTWMTLAMEEASLAAAEGEVPIGCVIVKDNQLLAKAHNLRENMLDVSGHAEILALRLAALTTNSWRLDGAEVFVTLEPCPMCSSALQQARVAKVTFAAEDPKTGAVVSTDRFFERPGLNHQVRVESGLLAAEAGQLLRNFFRKRRQLNKSLNRELGGRASRRRLMETQGSSIKTQLAAAETELPRRPDRPDIDTE